MRKWIRTTSLVCLPSASLTDAPRNRNRVYPPAERAVARKARLGVAVAARVLGSAGAERTSNRPRSRGAGSLHEGDRQATHGRAGRRAAPATAPEARSRP